MKKLLIVLSIFMLGMCRYNAECSYKDLKELNTFAAYVETSYKYNEETGYFDLTITNLGDKLYITGEKGEFYSPVSGSVTINNLSLGTAYKYNVYSSIESGCNAEFLRVINVNIPYMNYYYGSQACEGHEELNVCNSRFLAYQISENTFLSLLNKSSETKKNEEKPEDTPMDFWDKVIDYASKIYVKIILVVVTSIITISIYSVILRKVKHGF